ncbi:MAG TPA: hypothetical protein VG077_17215 [Verrucomicrobiae bacterium]|nr:hypothetical protein [Verrucomicrobiae bacterium]
MKRIIVIAFLTVATVVPSRATLLVRELWDNVTNGTPVDALNYPLQGQGNGTTSYGFLGTWNLNAADPALTNNVLLVASGQGGQDVWDFYSSLYGYLPEHWTAPGSLSLTANNTNGWDSGTWATRLMAASSWIKPNSNSTNYFSFRWVKRSFFYTVNGTNGYGADDAGFGVGFSAGALSNSAFVGIGITRSVAKYTFAGTGYTNLAGTLDIGDTPYITSGVLGQPGYPGHPGDSGGPYYVQAYAGDGSGTGVPNQCEGYTGSTYPISTNNTYMWGGCLVGRMVTSTGGNVEIDVKNYSGVDSYASAIDTTNDPAGGWDAVYHTTTSAVNLNYLLVWMYGQNNANPCMIDSIRVASTWSEALGQEAQTPIIIPSGPTNPTNTYFQGSPITLTNTSAIDNSTPLAGWYEWLYNSNATLNVVGIGSNSLTMPNPLIANSGYYSCVFSNGWETGSSLLVTSPPVHLIIIAPSAPQITGQPQPGERYSTAGAASFSFNVSAVGTLPFSYFWYQISGGTTNLVAAVSPASSVSNSYTMTAPIPPGAAGNYFVIVSNYLGTATSAIANFSVIVPTPGSYAAQVLANTPWAYWKLDENYGTTNLHDYFGGHDGWLDPTNTGINGTNTFTWGVYQQQPAAQLPGFPANHVGIYVPHNTYEAHANVPGVGNYSPNMTWMCWAYAPNPSANVLGEHSGIIWNRDYGDAGGYGRAFGLDFFQYSPSPGVTNYNELGYRWGGGTENPSAAYEGYIFPSGLYAPTNSWFFLAVTWGTSNNATVYVGSPTGPLTSATATLPASFDPAYPGTSYSNSYSILLGRGGYPWAEGLQNANDQPDVSLSDVAIFTNALSSNAIYQIYFAATSQLITMTNSAGNLVLSWLQGTLLSSTNVSGPYTPVAGNPSSPYTVPRTAPKQFFRVQN